MKNFLLLLLLGLMYLNVSAQTDPERSKKPFEKHPGLPAFYILGTDSSTVFNTYYIEEGRPTVLFYFAPDCEHCHITCKEILGSMDSMKQADFYFVTFSNLSELKPFATQYKLNSYKNIKMIGKDYQYFFPNFYAISNVPCVVVYDRKKQLMQRFNSTFRIPELIQAVKTGDAR